MVETVAELIGDAPRAPGAPRPFEMPVIEGYAHSFPGPGIWFDMPDEVYHAIPALSQSGIKKLLGSPMIFWAGCAWLNPRKKPREDAYHYTAGKAYHCRLLEGASAFAQRFAPMPDRSKHEGLLESVAEIKAAISAVELRDVAGNPIKIKPVTTVEEDDGKGGILKRPAKKEDWIAQLLELNPDAPIWSAIEERYLAEHAGKTLLYPDTMGEIEMAALMIERDPGIAPLMRGGMAEVSLFWYCPTTGIPMKARVDKMKVRRMIDLKTLNNQRERSMENAIRFEIAGYKYNLQPSVYFEAAREVRKIVREKGDDAIHVWDVKDEDRPLDDYMARVGDCLTFARKWASHVEPDEWTWIFQMKGDAPITRAVHYLRGGTVNMVTNDMVSLAKKRFAECAATFGTDPWLDIAPPYTLADEDIPVSATEI